MWVMGPPRFRLLRNFSAQKVQLVYELGLKALSMYSISLSAPQKASRDRVLLLMEEYCPHDEVQKLESEFSNHKMVRSDIDGYTERFHELASKYHQGNNRNQAHGKAFAPGVTEAPQDPNVVTGTFSLNNHFTTVLFDSGADYSFISTNFFPLIDMKPSVISPSYEIEIASGLKIVTNMIVQGCRLELEGHTFIIDLIPFGHVHEERPEGNLKQLKTMKVNGPKLKDIPVIREFPSVFPKDLSCLPPSREVEFRIDLIPRAMPVAKSLYRLEPTKMQELSNQLKEL
ncbi:putative reverse transcriptase domain-containing protein [Tanacetum coccineum]